MIRISNIKLKPIEENNILKAKAAKKLKISENEIQDIKIFRKSLDARKKDNIFYNFTIDVRVKNEDRIIKKLNSSDICKAHNLIYEIPKGKIKFNNPPIIVGFGPAGMFCALILAQMGLNPIVFERGEDVDKRTETVEAFWNEGKFNPKSNIQFGEGGAGTFSDGKLTTRIKDVRCYKVLEELVLNGAPEDILYSSKPHIGTDILKNVVKNIRKKIISLGGDIRFNQKICDIIINNGSASAVVTEQGEIIKSENIVLAIGHSARDTFKFIYEKGIALEQKPFAIGVRIEHKQKDINEAQYGKDYKKLKLGSADYKLTYTASNGRGVYTFCMCPGGRVVCAASEEGFLAVNGMSFYARDLENANSALIVQVYPEDFKSSHPLAGIWFQREIEKKAFEEAGKTYAVPCQKLDDFIKNCVTTEFDEVKPSCKPYVKLSNLNNIFPDFVLDSLKEAIPYMGKKLKGFDSKDAVLTAAETRSSSPVRIVRNLQTGESINTKGLYPVGEGAGYAGGIISAAVDGILTAEKIFNNSLIK